MKLVDSEIKSIKLFFNKNGFGISVLLGCFAYIFLLFFIHEAIKKDIVLSAKEEIQKFATSYYSMKKHIKIEKEIKLIIDNINSEYNQIIKKANHDLTIKFITNNKETLTKEEIGFLSALGNKEELYVFHNDILYFLAPFDGLNNTHYSQHYIFVEMSLQKSLQKMNNTFFKISLLTTLLLFCSYSLTVHFGNKSREKESELREIINLQENLIIILDPMHVYFLNKAFFKFLKTKDKAEVISKFLSKCCMINGKVGIEEKELISFLINNKEEKKELIILDDENNKNFFEIHASKINENHFYHLTKYVITLKNVTKERTKNLELEEENNSKREIIVEQSKVLILNKLLESVLSHWRETLSLIVGTADYFLIQKDFLYQIKEESIKNDIEEKMRFINETSIALSKEFEDLKNIFIHKKEYIAFNIKENVERMISLIKTGFQMENIEIEIKAEEDLIVEMKESILLILLLVFLTNSREALNKSKKSYKKIAISIKRKDKDFLHLKIVDNAEGINKTDLNKIFNYDYTTKENKKEGLGLYLAQEIIKQNQLKDMKIISKKGYGTKVLLKIPIKIKEYK